VSDTTFVLAAQSGISTIWPRAWISATACWARRDACRTSNNDVSVDLPEFLNGQPVARIGWVSLACRHTRVADGPQTWLDVVVERVTGRAIPISAQLHLVDRAALVADPGLVQDSGWRGRHPYDPVLHALGVPTRWARPEAAG